MKNTVNIALPKGRLGERVYSVLERIGYGCPGLLEGKRAVCYPGFESYLEGASVRTSPCVRDGNIITGRAMGAATEFALMLVAALCGDEKAREIREGVLA